MSAASVAALNRWQYGEIMQEPLNYGRISPIWRSRLKLIIVSGFVLAATCSAYFAFRYKNQIGILYMQWRATSYSPGTNTVAYLLDEPADPQRLESGQRNPPTGATPLLPHYVTDSYSMIRPSAADAWYKVDAWDLFYNDVYSRVAGMQYKVPENFLYFGYRSAKCGERIVIVRRNLPTLSIDGPKYWHTRLTLTSYSIVPATFKVDEQPRYDSFSHNEMNFYKPCHLRMKFGQSDPADLAKFTIDYAVDNIPYRLAGRMDDNGVVTLTDPRKDSQ